MSSLDRFFRGRRVAVTGASGYIASALVPRLQTLGAEVLLLSRKASRDLLAAFSRPDGLHCLEFDYAREPQRLKEALAGVGAVFHLAAQTSVGVSEAQPVQDAEVNLGLTLALLSSLEKGVPCVIAGTATVVGPHPTLPVKDGAAPHPITVYDLHKSFVEAYAEYFAREKGVPAVVLRLANVYGPGKTSSVADRGILQQVARAALAGRKVSVFGTGKFVRDYVFIDDVVEAFLAAAANAPALAGKSCFVCLGEGRSVHEAFQAVVDGAAALTGKRAELELRPDAPLSEIDKRDFVGEPSRLRELAGWEAKVSFAAGVEKTLKEFA